MTIKTLVGGVGAFALVAFPLPLLAQTPASTAEQMPSSTAQSTGSMQHDYSTGATDKSKSKDSKKHAQACAKDPNSAACKSGTYKGYSTTTPNESGVSKTTPGSAATPHTPSATTPNASTTTPPADAGPK